MHITPLEEEFQLNPASFWRGPESQVTAGSPCVSKHYTRLFSQTDKIVIHSEPPVAPHCITRFCDQCSHVEVFAQILNRIIRLALKFRVPPNVWGLSLYNWRGNWIYLGWDPLCASIWSVGPTKKHYIFYLSLVPPRVSEGLGLLVLCLWVLRT